MKKQKNIPRRPPWLRKRLAGCTDLRTVQNTLDRFGLDTVCREAHCPNLCECYTRKVATFMILGHHCTRRCRFCAVDGAEPSPPSPDEPRRLAEAVTELRLMHVVVTSPTRDDLPDGGSAHFAAVIAEVRARTDATIEVLTPDFQGKASDIARVVDAGPDIYNHNVETVPRLYPGVRPGAHYRRSLNLLRQAAGSGLTTKSGMMLGLGETEDEVVAVMHDLIDAGCQAITLGQYLAPSRAHHEVVEFIPPEVFDRLAETARGMGFRGVGSAPFVRSSYNAGAMAGELRAERSL